MFNVILNNCRRSVLHANGIHNDANLKNKQEVPCLSGETLPNYAHPNALLHYGHHKTSQNSLESVASDMQQAV